MGEQGADDGSYFYYNHPGVTTSGTDARTEYHALGDTRVRFVMIGGFLGAGKTTAIARLARQYMAAGKKVAIVTNDQAFNLVDTESLRAQGFDVGEVPGACFCCRFDELVETAEKFDSAPDVILAEPVGSCTDLAATVLEPLREMFGERYELGPLAVLLKPEHGLKILRAEQGVGFSPKAAYIFLKQLEEADILVVNKIDKLSPAEQQELIDLVSKKYPQKQVLAVSARTGEGFDRLALLLDQPGQRRESFMEVDYDVYAEGEAELGWLNCTIDVTGEAPFALDKAVLRLVEAIRQRMQDGKLEPAHLKVLGQSGEATAIANLVVSGSEAELSQVSGVETEKAAFIVNARAAGDPEQLEQMVVAAVEATAAELHLQAAVADMQRFRPGRPVPTHRMR
ncbi:GTP-binding protein [Lignipirellula cremea]|uniref:GTPase Era n=1 Tax=Lignipirellula cremea TaxID=2528010 RepID=A0A518DW33_9BACT|nr:GTP-binding protein [Lignipirellula cremea]QDU96045.1 GTPase Era [Lignipirellula cremea]